MAEDAKKPEKTPAEREMEANRAQQAAFWASVHAADEDRRKQSAAPAKFSAPPPHGMHAADRAPTPADRRRHYHHMNHDERIAYGADLMAKEAAAREKRARLHPDLIPPPGN